MDLNQFKGKFIEDTLDLLHQMEIDLLTLENNPNEAELVNQVFRAMHTIKGVASMYGFEKISEITHYLESIYDLIREHSLAVNKEIIDLSFKTSDLIKRIFEDENLIQQENIEEFNNLVEILDGIAKPKKSDKIVKSTKNVHVVTNNILSTYNIIFYPEDSLFKRNINIVRTFQDLFALGQYHIYKPDFLQDKENWSFFLVTDKPIEDIEDALFFILDDCIITKIANYNIFDENLNQVSDIDISKTIENFTKEILNNDIVKEKIIEKKKQNILPEKEKTLLPQKTTKKIESQQETVPETIKTKLNRITIDSSKLDTLMYLVSELITTNSQLVLATQSTKYEDIKNYLEKIDFLSKQFKNNALDIRLVPLNDLVVRFKRSIRDISNQLEKQVDFVIQGTETEIDKSTIDILAEPLMHIIRNCIDHGIEKPEQRIERGKNPEGMLKFTAYHSGNYIFIQIQDDGNGIDAQKIRNKAIEKGFIAADKELTKKEILDLIFLPGFSTAENLTQISGRGVGLDIVKKKISEVRGEISIDTEIGLGTSFTIKLNQSIAILDTMLIETDKNYFMLPISDVVVCESVKKDSIINFNSTHTIPYGNNLIQFIDLRNVFNLSEKYPEKLKTVIIKRNDRYLAIIADKIIGAHQAVLKSLGKAFKDHKFISSGSLLGDGNIAYLLDTNELFKVNNEKL